MAQTAGCRARSAGPRPTWPASRGSASLLDRVRAALDRAVGSASERAAAVSVDIRRGSCGGCRCTRPRGTRRRGTRGRPPASQRQSSPGPPRARRSPRRSPRRRSRRRGRVDRLDLGGRGAGEVALAGGELDRDGSGRSSCAQGGRRRRARAGCRGSRAGPSAGRRARAVPSMGAVRRRGAGHRAPREASTVTVTGSPTGTLRCSVRRALTCLTSRARRTSLPRVESGSRRCPACS